jgi:hypothetical protein
MKPIPSINPIVHSPPTIVQVVPDVAVLRDRIDMIVDHLKWIEKHVCVHSCCSVCSSNEIHGNVSVSRCI